MSDYVDWGEGVLNVGDPLWSQADVGTVSSGNFTVAAFKYLDIMVAASVADYRLAVTHDPNIVGIAAEVSNMDVRRNTILRHRIPVWTPRVRFAGTSFGGSTADIIVAPSNESGPYPGGARQDWSLMQATTLLAAAGVQQTYLEAWAGRAYLVIRPPAQPYTVLVEALDFQANLITELLALTVAAGVKVSQELWLPPHVNRVTVTDAGAGGTYVTSVTAAPTPQL